MSRAVKEDLSGLSAGERFSKRLGNFKVWLYNPENKTIMGDRVAKDWGKLLLYYLVFYSILASFTAIFFGLLNFMLPIRPNENIRGVCGKAPNSTSLCGPGPFFQALDLGSVGNSKDAKYTDEIFQFGLCEPAFVAIPRSLPLAGGEPSLGFSFDDNRRGYKQFTDEVDRVFCQEEFNGKSNPDCTNGQINQRILPLVPTEPGSPRKFRSPVDNDFVNIADELSEGGSPKALYKFDDNTNQTTDVNTYETYIVFFRFNKVWNYQPYHTFKTAGNGQDVPIENNIGLSCALSQPCTSGSARNYRNELVQCDKSTISSDNRVKIDMLSNVMTNYDGFPWRGGALNMNFGSMAVTFKTGATTDYSSLTIDCSMGVEVTGFSGVARDGSQVSASAKTISNMNKYAYGRAYTRSTGSSFSIFLN